MTMAETNAPPDATSDPSSDPRSSDATLTPDRLSLDRVPAAVLVVVGMGTVQIGAALAKSLFETVGPTGVVFLRVGFAALILVALSRPSLGSLRRARAFRRSFRRDAGAVIAFGLVLAFMNLSFYSSIARVPLGVSVTVEFLGPLAVAVAGSRRPLDVLWALVAAAGILLLAPVPVGDTLRLDPVGLALAGLAGVLWAAYILLSARVGRAVPGVGGLAVAMTIGGIAMLPLGVLTAGSKLLDPGLLLAGAVVALLSSVVPYSLELAALRRMSTGAFGVLMSLEPAIASIVGLVVLREALTTRTALAMVLVTIASIAATRTARPDALPEEPMP
jgi:inner membrane transporter RhtA